MRLTSSKFRHWKRKAVTFLGMSGVGKTRLAYRLRNQHWFHYSGDYRIGTRYLDEPILDNIKLQAMQVAFLRELLRSDSIHINNNITVDNLKPVSTFIGKIGNLEKGGLGKEEFQIRQNLHHNAEIAAMKDVPEFIRKSNEIYGYDHFVNDAGGSLCELDDDSVMDILAEHTLILYIKATEEDEKALISRAESAPKPMYYQPESLEKELKTYMEIKKLDYAALIEPDDFVRWVFPRLFYSRIPRYEAIAEQYGYTVTTNDIAKVETENDFIDLICSVLD